MLRNSVLSDLYKDLLAMCETMDMGIEGLHTETGAGVLEAALRVNDALPAADSAALFKLFTKVLAQKRDWLATFMAKWSKDWPGCGGHMHMSLWKGGKPAFYDEKAPHRMSTTMRHFVGGQQALMPELLAMVAADGELLPPADPGLLGADRRRPGASRTAPPRCASFRARPSRRGSSTASPPPTRTRTWRWPPRSARACGASRTRSTPASRSRATAYEKKHPAKSQLPRTLMEAARRLKASKPARNLFGDAFVDHYSATREWEEREFRKAITDWELDRYMEII